MVDRKVAGLCAALVLLMFGVAFWRIGAPDPWPLASRSGATAPALFLLIFPSSSAFLVGLLYWSNLRARAPAEKLEPWRQWGAFLSVVYCVGMLSIQGVLTVGSLNIGLPLDLPAIGRTLAIALPMMCLLAINQAPKLPHFERRLAGGWELGPIYGPRYIRTVSRNLALFMVAAIAYHLAMTREEGRSISLLFSIAAACLVTWSVSWRFHLARKWKRQQSQLRG